MKKQYKSSRTKNHKIKKKYSKLFLDFVPEIKKSIVGKSSG